VCVEVCSSQVLINIGRPWVSVTECSRYVILYCRSKYTKKYQNRCVAWKNGKDWVENSCIVDLCPRPTAMALDTRKQLEFRTRVGEERSVPVVSVVSGLGLNLV
jgi:hypothetical protein